MSPFFISKIIYSGSKRGGSGTGLTSSGRPGTVPHKRPASPGAPPS